MFTVEFEFDGTYVVTLDEHDLYEDVELLIESDNTAYIRQYDEHLDDYQIICMSYQQLLDIVTAIGKTEGLYKIEGTPHG